MTLPFERSLALINARKFLADLMDPRKTPGVPKKVREEAYRILKHYPVSFYMQDPVNNLDLETFEKEE